MNLFFNNLEEVDNSKVDRDLLRSTELGLIASTYFIACQMEWGTSIEAYWLERRLFEVIGSSE